MSDKPKEQREQKFNKHHELLTVSATYRAFADLRKELKAQGPTKKEICEFHIFPAKINPFTPRDTRISPDISLEELVDRQLKEIENLMHGNRWKSSLPEIRKSLEALPKDHKYRVAFEIARSQAVLNRSFSKIGLLLILLAGIAFVCVMFFS